MKAIETTFDGHRFRSRLEARWAVAFSELGLPYEYEKQGYDLGDGVYYLPDFFLPQQDCWFEVKPTQPTGAEIDKARRLAAQSGKWVFMTTESYIGPFRRVVRGSDLLRSEGTHRYFRPNGDYDGGYALADCRACGRLDFGLWGEFCRHCDADVHPTARLLAALEAASSARFEHGENPSTKGR